MNDRPIKHLNQVELARRWALSHRTLERWRWENIGPTYLKIGGRVVYRLEDIEAFEQAQVHKPTRPILVSLRELPPLRGGRT